MLHAQSSPRSEEIRQAARHVLFVEGRGDDALDPLILRVLLPDAVSVRPLGASHYIEAAAEALHKHHPDYYFLIDRDHRSEEFVRHCWDHFPDPETSNLLVWPRRELENYFIIPDYLSRSKYGKCSKSDIAECILKECRRRLFLDVANQVIVAVREKQKLTWIKVFTRVEDFPTAEVALDRLVMCPAFAERVTATQGLLATASLKRTFEDTLETMTGGTTPLQYGQGKWLEMIAGKEILNAVAGPCFTVTDANGHHLQGAYKLHEIAKDLVRLSLEDQPEDFQQLHMKISQRVGRS